ncbi:MAG: Gfo/Idh/MocA family oxidoreductase [Methanophagales archaeon]|nr:Gfo/Idh/MocA family oxidoreductase [Methanophagales archaeon]
MKRIRVGVIGVGAMGKHHTRLYSDVDGVELVGVADVNDRAAAEVAAEYNTAAFTDVERLLKSDLDAVSIAVPTSLHKEVALNAANQGVHMLIEKPIADSLSSADAIIAAVRRENLKLMIGHIERFNHTILKFEERACITFRHECA